AAPATSATEQGRRVNAVATVVRFRVAPPERRPLDLPQAHDVECEALRERGVEHHTTTGQNASRSAAHRVTFQEAMVEDAVRAGEDGEPSGALHDRAIDDPRLPEAAMWLPHSVDRACESSVPVPDHVADRLARAIICEHDLEIRPRLILEALQDEL